jgi:NitT/TauT family transport system substrate-binding protein
LQDIQERPQVVRAIIVARHKAVEYMNANRKESAAIIAKVLQDGSSGDRSRDGQSDGLGTVKGVPYCGSGNIEYESLNNLVRAMNLIGIISGELDWNKYVDESYLPADLQSKKK